MSGDMVRMVDSIKAVIPIAWALANRFPNGSHLSPDDRDRLGLTKESATSCGPCGSSTFQGKDERSDYQSTCQTQSDSSGLSESSYSEGDYRSPGGQSQQGKRSLQWELVNGVRTPKILVNDN